MTYGFRNVEDEIMLCDELWRLINHDELFVFQSLHPKIRSQDDVEIEVN